MAEAAENATHTNRHSPSKISYFGLKSAQEPPNSQKKYLRRRRR
jgi:hypothetical protein